MTKKEKIFTCILIILVFAVIFIVTGFMISLLWNNVIPTIFGLPTINWYQGTELSLLIYALGLPLGLAVNKSNEKK